MKSSQYSRVLDGQQIKSGAVVWLTANIYKHRMVPSDCRMVKMLHNLAVHIHPWPCIDIRQRCGLSRPH